MQRLSWRRALLAPAVGLASVAALAAAPAAATPAVDAAGAVGSPEAHFVVLAPRPGDLTQQHEVIRAAGGTILQSWPQIGVVVAKSANEQFATDVRFMLGTNSVGATRAYVEFLPPAERAKLVQRRAEQRDRAEPAGPVPATAATAAAEPLEANQWNLRQIQADVANAISGGSRDILVGVLDTGVDGTHPDLAANYDAANSVNCAKEGVPDTSPEALVPTHLHGTHVAGTVAAARNGVGVAGVAPNVRVASVMVGDADAFFYPEYVVCGFVWAAEHGMHVTNSSWFADPWWKWCANDPDQRASAEAMRRAINYAAGRGVVNVVSLGNSNWDLSYNVVDTNSPSNHDVKQTRTVGNNCPMVPIEIDGTVGVSSVGPTMEKAYYSNYGITDTEITAPGGDRARVANTPDANGRVLSTVDNHGYGYLQGTSMAAPHVAGVAALIRSKHPTWSADQVKQALQAQANRIPCPPNPYNPPFPPDLTGPFTATCEGGQSGTGFYGAGLVDALDAVTK